MSEEFRIGARDSFEIAGAAASAIPPLMTKRSYFIASSPRL
jgi:hypothetical protein